MLDHLNRIIFAACLAVQAMADNEPSSCPALLTGGTFKYRDKTKATAAVHCKLFGEQELWTSWVNPMVPPTIIGADGTHMVREHTHVMLHYDVYSVSCKLVKHSLFFVTFFLLSVAGGQESLLNILGVKKKCVIYTNVIESIH